MHQAALSVPGHPAEVPFALTPGSSTTAPDSDAGLHCDAKHTSISASSSTPDADLPNRHWMKPDEIYRAELTGVLTSNFFPRRHVIRIHVAALS